MDITVPTALRALSSAGVALKELAAWSKRARGSARSLIGELRDNLSYLDMVAQDGVELGEVLEKLSVSEYKRLSNEGFDFNTLQKKRIEKLPSLSGTELEPWGGKSTEDLVHSIYEKLIELKIRYPHVAKVGRYRWGVRVNNIRKRIWLLQRHVQG